MSISDDPKERTTVSLPRSLARRLEREAEVTERPVSAVVRDALQEYFGRQEPEPLPVFVGIGASGTTDTSERVHEVVGDMIEERRIGGRDRP